MRENDVVQNACNTFFVNVCTGPFLTTTLLMILGIW